MGSQQLTVHVLDGTAVLESVRRPVRLAPDGFAGVVYAGAVYPLFTGDVIDISGAAWEMEDCNRFLLSGSVVPYAPKPGGTSAGQQFGGLDGEWNIESGPFGHYVFFNASERLAALVVDALEVGGIPVQRWDVSHRPASDGKFYDWFARLRYKGTHEDASSRVSAIFSPAEVPRTGEDATGRSTSRIEDLEAQVEQLLDLVGELRERLNASESEVAQLNERLTTAAKRESWLAVEFRRAVAHQKLLHEEIAELARVPNRATDAKVLLAQQSETEEFLELALSENAELIDSLKIAGARADEAEVQVIALESRTVALQERLEELAENERERRRVAVGPVGPRRGILGFFDSAFSRLEFVLAGDEVLANIDVPSALLRSLVMIDMGEMIGKDLEGLRGWREVSKLRTGVPGSESMGRIYYRPDGDRVLVSVHVKQDDKEQRRHLERLRSI